MSNILVNLQKNGLVKCQQDFVISQLQYLCITGSYAYGVNTDKSDRDCYGFCIPEKKIMFPHLDGKIEGFSKNIQKFDQWEQQHIYDPSAQGGRGMEYDFAIYSIIKFFSLVMENNPNMIDCLFVPQRCVLFCTPIGNMIRENRRMFLHKGAWPKFKGYAFSQLHRMKTAEPTGKRAIQRDENGIDRKFLYHIVRLLDEIEQILTEGDLDLERNREQLKAIRRGDEFAKIEDVHEWFTRREKELEIVYAESKLPWGPDESKITQLLFDCLEHHFGNIDDAIKTIDPYVRAVGDIKAILNKLN